MSLRYFHISFILLSALLCGGVAWWNSENQGIAPLTYGFGAAAAILPFYGVWFLRKSRNLV
ncbi:MAG: hypothetical protein RL088_1966 [Verrucomicrobiota bacterium]